MPVIPEKHLLSQIGHAISAQCRGHEETSPSSLAAVTRRAPCEPSPLPQKLPSGLSRPEQLLVLQRYLNFPFVPSYVGQSGGVVLDRVVHTLGSRGSSWWATITARLRAQRAWLQHKAGRSRKNSLLDPTNYALSIQSNSRFSSTTSVCANLDFDDFNQVLSLAKGTESDVPLRMQAELKQNLPYHQLTAEALLHSKYTTTSSGVDNGIIQVPRVLSVDIASNSRKGGLRYQAGLFQVVSNAEGDVEDQTTTKLHTSKYLQCAATVEKDFVLWKGNRRNGREKKSKRSLSPFELAYNSNRYSTELKKRLTLRKDTSSKPVEKEASEQPRKKMPYSSLLHTPYFSFAGVAGVLAQAELQSVPLPDGNSIGENDVREGKRKWTFGGGDNDFWTTKRFFASAGVNMQVGNFSKHVLDFTSLSLKLDTGMPLSSNPQHPQQPGHSPSTSGGATTQQNGSSQGGAFLEHYQERKHMLSASVAQQVFGPVRFRADARCQVDLNKPSLKDPFMNQLKSIVSINANRPELVYGLDVALPYMGGAARFSLWYSPTQKQGLGEIRLL